MADTSVPTLVAARPGVMRNSLLAFLRTSPLVQVIAIADDTATLLNHLRREPFATLVLDADLCDRFLLVYLLRQLHSEYPLLNCVVLVNNLRQQHLAREAGASTALLKGFLDERLRTAVLNESEPPAAGLPSGQDSMNVEICR